MATVFIILSCMLFIAALLLVWPKIVISPLVAWLGLVVLSLAKTPEGYHMVPLNSTILFGWFTMTLVVTVATILQPAPLRFTTRGVGYILVGAIAGMAVGLLGFTFASYLSLAYGVMITATAAGSFFGFLIYTNTPEGVSVASGSGHFLKYFLAKAFPIAITVMQMGVAAVLVIALYR